MAETLGVVRPRRAHTTQPISDCCIPLAIGIFPHLSTLSDTNIEV